MAEEIPPEQLTPYPLRLQKFLARAGAASRRGSEDLMTAGRVTVNGVVVSELGSKVDPRCDTVCIDGRPVSLADTHSYLMLNKPAGYLTTMEDPQGRPTVKELVPTDEHPGLFPVGRLDYDTTGLLLFTTDGDLAHRLLHPRHQVAKRYRAVVDGAFSEADADQLRTGIQLHDGPTQPALITIGEVREKQLSPRERRRLAEDATFSLYETTVWCTITEGRKRQVKRMFAHLGFPVLTLEREAFGPLELGDLAPGTHRPLTPQELQSLQTLD
ncbi:MAG: rRNA pseudouridine synthase [Coriobacteriia bacterium]|nr:rRNA pseudouridine synthase [Coriobacteriia bacterium]